jgi:shikimate dehydrogenase
MSEAPIRRLWQDVPLVVNLDPRSFGLPGPQQMTDRYAVIGNPIGHSKSPLIHSEFARQAGQDMEYGRLLGNLEDFAVEVRRFFGSGGCGMNVTVPFKEEAWRISSERSAEAQSAGAVNTLSLGRGGQLRGDNTDGVGLLLDLTENNGFELAGKRVLLLGAGGAARGVLRTLLEGGPAELVVANRTAAKAEALAASSKGYGPLRGSGLDALAGGRFDLIINATSAGLAGKVPSLPDDCLARHGWAYDMLYGEGTTPFCRWGAAHGADRTLDGLGMLVEQAAEAFFLWRGVRPETGPVIALLRGGGSARIEGDRT